MLTGRLGTLNKDGKQVGGFLDWRISATLDAGVRGKWRSYKERGWKARADRFWILEELDGDEFFAIFYQIISDRLVAVSQYDVVVKVPSAPLNTIVIGHLEMKRG